MPANRELRAALAYYDVKQWQLAERLGFSQQYLCQLLRRELDAEHREEYIKLIKSLAKEEENGL